MPRKSKPKQVANGAPFATQLILDLADRLDPPESASNAIVESVWVEPPDIVDWAHGNFIDPTTEKLVRLEDHQQRIFRYIFKGIWAKLITTVLWSEPKKSGKTASAGLAGSYWGNYVEAPNEIISIANDKEQAQGRIYAAMVPTLKRLGWNVPDQKPSMSNEHTGTKVKAIGTAYEGEAGGNPGLTLWSELWAYTSERRKRLWEEMTPVPTRRFSVRWVETYAGFLNESDILWNLYCQVFKDGNENQLLGQKIPELDDLPVYYVPQSKMLVYWSHEHRMPWQTEEYYIQQRADLRPNAYKRLHQNEWVSSTSVFIEPAQWDVLEECESLNEEGDLRFLFVGADAGVHNDSAALVISHWDLDRQGPDIIAAWEWKPQVVEGSDVKEIDLEQTLGAKLIWLLDTFKVEAVYYDNYQLHTIMTNLRKKYDPHNSKKLFVDFPQNSGRIESDNALYQWIVTKKLHRILSPALRTHVLNAVAEESERGFRLDKEKTKAKIDLAVASSMSCYGASIRPRAARKFVRV